MFLPEINQHSGSSESLSPLMYSGETKVWADDIHLPQRGGTVDIVDHRHYVGPHFMTMFEQYTKIVDVNCELQIELLKMIRRGELPQQVSNKRPAELEDVHMVKKVKFDSNVIEPVLKLGNENKLRKFRLDVSIFTILFSSVFFSIRGNRNSNTKYDDINTPIIMLSLPFNTRVVCLRTSKHCNIHHHHFFHP